MGEDLRLSASLHAADLHFRLMVEAVRDYAIFMLDANGLVATWNAGAQQIKGYSAPEILGKPYEAFFEPEAIQRQHPQHLLRRAREDGHIEDEGWRVRRDGSRFWADAVITLVRGPRGEIIGYAKVTRDMTEQRLRDEERERLRVRLVLSDRLASVGTLAAGIAHEINNPLGSAMSNLEMARDDLVKLADVAPPALLGEIGGLLADAREGCDRVRRLVRDLNAFSRGEAGKLHPVDVRAVAELAVRMTANTLRHRAVVVMNLGEVPEVVADHTRLGHVFVNLLLNAAQAVPEGNSDRNRVTILTKTAASGEVVVEVGDSGSGIAAEHLGRIFDPFFTTKPVGEGMGLGLSITHAIVKELGGQITVESEVGKGSVFRVSLPAHTPVGARTEQAAARPLVSATSTGHVVVIDDDALVAKTIARVLRGHDVVVFGDAREALARLREGMRPDAILCDMMMPQMNGMEFLSELSRTDPALAERIVFVTGGAFTPVARAFLDAASNQRLEKPIDHQQLRAIVRSLVESSRR